MTSLPEPAGADSARRSHRSGNWYASCMATPPPSEWPTNDGLLHVEGDHEVADARRVRAERVVAARLGRLAVAEQVGRDDGVAVLGEDGHDVLPRRGAAGQAVHEDDGRAFARHAVGDVMTVQLDVAHGEGAGALCHRADGRGAPSRLSTCRPAVCPSVSFHQRMSRWSPAGLSMETSVTSTRNSGNGPSGTPPWASLNAVLNASNVSSSVTRTARPLSLASPSLTSLSTLAACSATRGSRCMSAALWESGMEPSHSSSSVKKGSMPLMRGPPSFFSVASMPEPGRLEPRPHLGRQLGGGRSHLSPRSHAVESARYRPAV